MGPNFYAANLQNGCKSTTNILYYQISNLVIFKI